MRSVASTLAFVLITACAGAGMAGCSKGSAEPSKPSAAPTGTSETIAVPGAAPAPAAAPTPAPDVAAVPAGAPAAPAAPAAPDASFQLQVTPPGPGAAGAEAVAHVVVVPGKGYKMNKDYPTKLTVQAPAGLAVAKAEQVLADAASFDPHQLAFDVKLTPAKAGSYPVSGTIKFAVCTDATCDPKKQAIAFDVVAK